VHRAQICLALIAGLSLSLLAGAAQAQSPSPYAVETNMPGFYAYTQPPAGFDPSTASAADLELYGYPPRPATNEPDELADWKKQTNPALRRVIPHLLHTDIHHRPLSIVKMGTNSAFSLNWSGYAVVHTEPSFNSVKGSWIVPSVQPPFGGCAGYVYSSEWVGIDGFSNDLAFQAGAAADAACSGGKIYYPWVEWLPGAEAELELPTGYTFKRGDYIIVTVDATDFSDGKSSSGELIFTDVTGNWQISGALTAASLDGTYIVGDSAEWIVERPEVGNTLSSLANYIADAWSGAKATDSNQAIYHPGSPNNAQDYMITMLDNNDEPISFVDLFGTHSLWFFDEGSAL
jgi:hypothetical protein